MLEIFQICEKLLNFTNLIWGGGGCETWVPTLAEKVTPPLSDDVG